MVSVICGPGRPLTTAMPALRSRLEHTKNPPQAYDMCACGGPQKGSAALLAQNRDLVIAGFVDRRDDSLG